MRTQGSARRISIDSCEPLRVLIVAEDQAVHKLLALILHPPRFRLVPAPTPEAAMRLLVPPPGLIILDMGFAGEAAEEFCHHVHRDDLTRSVPILAITGRETLDLEHSTVAACAQELIRKPIDAAELAFYVEVLQKRAAYELRRIEAEKLERQTVRD